METKRKYSGRATSIPSGLAVGSLISLLITLAAAAIIAKITDMKLIEQDQIGYWIIALLLIAAFTGSKISCTRIKHRKIMVCTISGLLYIAILISITALFFGGQYEAVGVTSAVVMAGSSCAGLLEGPKKTAGKGRKHRTVPR